MCCRKSALKKLSGFLEKYLSILNTHMVHFFTGNEWAKLDEQLKTDLMALDESQLVLLPDDYLHLGERKLDHIGPSLMALMDGIKQHSLESLGVLDDLATVWKEMHINPLSSTVPFDKFMTVKKTHEVTVLCDIIASLANNQEHLIVDLGCGRGSLGLMLSLNHDLFVSGIDAMGFDAHAQSGRQSKLEKSYNAEVKKAKNIEDPQKVGKIKFYRTTQYLSSDFNLKEIVHNSSQHFERRFDDCHIGLVGLHTCGNLASTSAKLFVHSPLSSFFCNVGCCYHLLDELDNANGEPGFPLSQQLKELGYALGRNARMVSSQPLERYASEKKLQPPVLFYRSLLQVILEHKLPHIDPMAFQVGRQRKPIASFLDYARWALGKLQLNIEVTDEEIKDYEDRYCQQHRELNAFFQLRLLLAPLVENIILLDRLVYLDQQEPISHSFLVRVFTPVTSPRCYALIAFKKPSHLIKKADGNLEEHLEIIEK